MYNFSFFDANLLVAGVLLAITAHTIRTTVDEMPATHYTLRPNKTDAKFQIAFSSNKTYST